MRQSSETDEIAAVYKLSSVRWAEGVICPKCYSKKHYWLDTVGKYRCSECLKEFTFSTDTPLHGSKLFCPWVAIFEMAANKEAITPTGLMRNAKVTYKTAWIVYKKFTHLLPLEILDEDDENWWTFDKIADYVLSGAEASSAYRGLFQRGHGHIKAELHRGNYPHAQSFGSE